MKIDLNSDLGEHPDQVLDEQIMPHISSCNIACGGHAGDEVSVRKTVEFARTHGVAIGAHPSFPDRENFGRKVISMNPEELRRSLMDQIQLVKKTAEEVGLVLHHIKPHGTLYNQAAIDQSTSQLICEVLTAIDPELKLYGLAHSVTEKVASEAGIRFIGEAFADRRYEPDKTLRSRENPGAVIHEVTDVLGQVEELVFRQRVFSNDWIEIKAKTICLHSDTEGAVTLAKRIHEHLVNKGAIIATV